jgi:hypothetical protein
MKKKKKKNDRFMCYNPNYHDDDVDISNGCEREIEVPERIIEAHL